MDWKLNLTEIEQTIVRLICEACLSRKEIADFLNRSPETISTHMKNIFSKKNITKVTELSKLYFKQGTLSIVIFIFSLTVEQSQLRTRRRNRRQNTIETIIQPVTVHGL